MKHANAMRVALATLLVTAATGAGVNLAGPAATTSARASEDPVPLRLELNVPANRLYVYEHGEHTRTFRVSVGLPGNQTPAGDYTVKSVIWNPWWHPPNSSWARGRKPEAPGPSNPMGRVKLNFAPLLYIHGTVERGAIGDPASRGCVRMRNEDVIALTKLVHGYLTPKLDGGTIEQLVQNEKLTRTYNLGRGVPFEVNYNVAAVRDGFLLIYPDVYSRVKDYEKKVHDALRAEGVDLERVNHQRLEELMEHGRRTKVAIGLDELQSVAPGQQEPR